MKPQCLIDVPPPTISGLLHMGHVFSYCHMDFIARSKRYHGADILYPFCFDCNGLPTERLAHKEKIFATNDIIAFAQNKSEMYARFFDQIGMGWSEHHYHTYDQNAIKLAEMSFDDLKEKGYAYKAVRDYFWCPLHKVSVSQAEIDEEGRYERSGAKVELRKGEGWFINIMDHIPRIREMIDRIRWQPNVFRERLHHWLNDLTMDWSVSRERNYGIHIPGEPSNVVFDTWFTSSLSPQMTWAAYTGTPSLECPVFDIRFQAHDIIRTWALFTIIKSMMHNNQIPWKRIIISGHALDPKGRKISKTAGNFVEPQTYIEKYGMAGVRYWAALSQIGTDTRCDESVMKKGKHLLNKLRNAHRFICLGKEKGGRNEERWIDAIKMFGRFQTYMDADYNWPISIEMLTDFFWHEFCDKWIEECKTTPMYDTLSDILDIFIETFAIFFPELPKMITEQQKVLR